MTKQDYEAFDLVINSYLDAEVPGTIMVGFSTMLYALGFGMLAAGNNEFWLWVCIIGVMFLDWSSNIVLKMYLTPKKIPILVAGLEENEDRKKNLKKIFRRVKFSAMSMLVYLFFTTATGYLIAVSGYALAATVWTVNAYAFVYYTWYFQREVKLLMEATAMLKQGHTPNVDV